MCAKEYFDAMHSLFICFSSTKTRLEPGLGLESLTNKKGKRKMEINKRDNEHF